MKTRKYESNGYMFTRYYGRQQKLKYDNHMDDYYFTFQGRRFYLNECISSSWYVSKDNIDENIVGSWQEGYCVYLLQSDDECLEHGRIIYCPPAR